MFSLQLRWSCSQSESVCWPCGGPWVQLCSENWGSSLTLTNKLWTNAQPRNIHHGQKADWAVHCMRHLVLSYELIEIQRLIYIVKNITRHTNYDEGMWLWKRKLNLFVHFSSAFKTIIPNLLLPKLTQLSVPTFICQWINSFLTDRQQLVRLGKLSSSTRMISTGAPQGYGLSPLLFSLYANDSTSKDPSVKLLKSADDTTLIGLIQDGDVSTYRQEVKELAVWCSLNNLELNTLKTVDHHGGLQEKPPPALPPLTIMNSTVTAVESFRFLGTSISQDLKWDNHNLPQELLKKFYSAIIESILCTAITVWFSSATKSDLWRLRRVVRTANKETGFTVEMRMLI